MIKRKTKKKIIGFLSRLLALALWISLLLLILLVSPSSWWIIAGFFALLFLVFGISLYLIIKNLKLAVIISLYLVFLSLLQLFRQLHWLNLVLLSAFCLALIWY